MSRRKWADRVREIKERNPSALHPILRNPNPGSPAWDSVEWQLSGDGEFQAAEVARPIVLVLRWLRTQSLLTDGGVATLEAAERGQSLERLRLDRSMVIARGQVFLDTHYDRWHAAHFANIVMSTNDVCANQAIADLNAWWAKA
jgi:hypothetical protein